MLSSWGDVVGKLNNVSLLVVATGLMGYRYCVSLLIGLVFGCSPRQEKPVFLEVA